jgi:hypothetical protein
VESVKNVKKTTGGGGEAKRKRIKNGTKENESQQNQTKGTPRTE